MKRTRRRGAVVLTAALACGALQMVPGTVSAVDSYVYTQYAGNDCVYETNPARIAMTYSSSAGAKSTTSIRCPILRTKPTYAHYYAEIIFGTPPSGNPTVSCKLNSGDEKDNRNGTASQNMTIYSSGSSMFLGLALSQFGGETTYWSAMGNDATAHWRTYSISCDVTNSVPILGYQITEYP